MPPPPASLSWPFILHDGFDGEEVATMLELTGWTCEALTGYRFTNVVQLERDYRAGVFAPAFPPPLTPAPGTPPATTAEASP